MFFLKGFSSRSQSQKLFSRCCDIEDDNREGDCIKRPAGDSLGSVRSASILIVCLGILAGNAATADVLREQVIQLQRGWNAVYLEVEPLDPAPATVFEGKPIDIVTRYFRLVSPVQFISDPSDELWKKEGWGAWYAPSRDDAFLSKLHSIQGNKTYLVHATADYQWTVTGKVYFERRKWLHDSYNLVGFNVDPQSPPSFGRFFDGADGKMGRKIYRLSSGKWVKILSPDSTPMRSGEAFWTYCEGNTGFQGPIDIDGPATGLLDLGRANHRRSIGWSHVDGSPAQVSVEAVAPQGDSPALPLRRIVRDLDTLTDLFPPLVATDLSGVTSTPSGQLSIQVRREEMTAPTQHVLLKFTDGAGAIVWVPVSASKTAE